MIQTSRIRLPGLRIRARRYARVALVGVSMLAVDCVRRNPPPHNAVTRRSTQTSLGDDSRVVQAATAQTRADIGAASHDPRLPASEMLDAALVIAPADVTPILAPSPTSQQSPVDASVVARAGSLVNRSELFARAPTGHAGPNSSASYGEADHYIAFEGSWHVAGFADGGVQEWDFSLDAGHYYRRAGGTDTLAQFELRGLGDGQATLALFLSSRKECFIVSTMPATLNDAGLPMEFALSSADAGACAAQFAGQPGEYPQLREGRMRRR